MPKYLLEVSYTLDGVRGVMAKGGSAREQAARAAAESVGGTLESFYFAFGSADVFTVADLPDNAAAAALALTVTAGGGRDGSYHRAARARRDRRGEPEERQLHAAGPVARPTRSPAASLE